MSAPYPHAAHILPLLAMALLSAAVAAYAWRHRSVPGATAFAAAMATAAAIALSGAAERAGAGLPAKTPWFHIHNTCLLLSAIVTLCFALEYAGLGKWLTRRNLALLFAPVPLFALISFAGIMHDATWLVDWDDGRIHSQLTPWAIAFLAYGTCLSLLSSALLLNLFARSPLHRWPVGLILLGQLALMMVGPAQILEAFTAVPVAPLAIAYALYALLLALAIFGFRLFNVVPVARNLVIERMRAGLLVLDARDRVVELNDAAAELLGAQANRVLGQEAAQALRASPGLVEALREAGSGRWVEAQVGSENDGAGRSLEARFAPLPDRRGRPDGRLILLHDVTPQRLAQARAAQQQQALAVLQERARVARDLHDGIGQVVGYAQMQAQAARAFLAQGEVAVADEYLAQLSSAAHEARAALQERALSAPRATADETGLLDALRQIVTQFQRRYGIAGEVAALPGWREDAVEPAARAEVLRIIHEALSNTRKHAQARTVRATMGECDGRLRICIVDDGIGFDTARLTADDEHRFGLRSMRERAVSFGGNVVVQSAPGRGTRVSVSIPMRATPPPPPPPAA